MMQKINQLAQLTTKKQENELISGYINSIHYNLQSSPHFSTKISWCSEIVSQTTIHLLIHSKNEFHHLEELEGKKWPDVPWFLGVLQQRGTRQCAWCDKITSFFYTVQLEIRKKKGTPTLYYCWSLKHCGNSKEPHHPFFHRNKVSFEVDLFQKKYVVYVFHKWGISLFNWKMFSSQFQIWLKIMIFNNSTLNFKKKDFIMKRLPNKFIYNLWIFFPHSYLKKMF